jgi:hypothetical protein
MDDFSSGFSYLGLVRTAEGLLAAVLAAMRRFGDPFFSDSSSFLYRETPGKGVFLKTGV